MISSSIHSVYFVVLIHCFRLFSWAVYNMNTCLLFVYSIVRVDAFKSFTLNLVWKRKLDEMYLSMSFPCVCGRFRPPE